MEFLQHTLPNGLEVVAECNGEAHSAAVAFIVRTGARDEHDAVAGVSHFLEHMAFKGAGDRTAEDVNREFDAMGARNANAYTSEETTVFCAAVLPEYQTHAMELLAEILRPALRPDDFDLEKQVILEEIKTYDDQPPFGAEEKARAFYFGSHPLGRSILGTVESISQLSVEAMRGYFEHRYQPGNIVLAGAGRIDFDRLVAAAGRACGRWAPADSPRAVEPAAPRAGFHVLHKQTATQQYAMQLAPGPAADDPARYAAKLLAVVLGDDTGSRLYWELVDTGLAEHAGLMHCEYEGAGLMWTQMACEPDAAAENLQRIRDVYRRVEQEGITAAELEQAKNKVRARIVLPSERPFMRLFAVGADWLYRRRYLSVRDELEMVAAVGLDDIGALLAKYPLTFGATVVIGPLADVAQPR